MKKPSFLLFGLVITLAFVSVGRAAVLLEDDWDDGDRTDTTLPEESAWFASSVAGVPTLSAEPGLLNGHVLFAGNVSSRLWITHFTSAGAPVELGIGDTLRITLEFSASNVVAASATQRGLRIGLFNFSEPGAARVTADGFSTGAGGGAPGTNVTGYMLNMNFAQTTTSSPFQILKRTDLTNINLMGATAAYTALSSGGGPAGNPGFSNGVPYLMQFLVKRLTASVEITTTFTNANGWSLTHTATDAAAPTFRFDGLALRPNGTADTAETFMFTRLKVETIPYELRLRIRYVPPELAQITWNALPGKTYEVYVRPNLRPSSDWALLTTVTEGLFVDRDSGFEDERYYKVQELP